MGSGPGPGIACGCGWQRVRHHPGGFHGHDRAAAADLLLFPKTTQSNFRGKGQSYGFRVQIRGHGRVTFLVIRGSSFPMVFYNTSIVVVVVVVTGKACRRGHDGWYYCSGWWFAHVGKLPQLGWVSVVVTIASRSRIVRWEIRGNKKQSIAQVRR